MSISFNYMLSGSWWQAIDASIETLMILLSLALPVSTMPIPQEHFMAISFC